MFLYAKIKSVVILPYGEIIKGFVWLKELILA